MKLAQRFVFQQLDGDPREQDLAAMGGTFDARSTVQRAPKIITVPEFRCPDMDAHPNRQGTDILPVGG